MMVSVWFDDDYGVVVADGDDGGDDDDVDEMIVERSGPKFRSEIVAVFEDSVSI